MGVSQKRGGPRDPKGYRGIIRGLYRTPLRDYIGVILRNTHVRVLLSSYLEGFGFRVVTLRVQVSQYEGLYGFRSPKPFRR